MTLYDDLGVSPQATTAQIISAYRRLAKTHHPDVGGDPEEFSRIQRAADILRDPEKRRRYDETGNVDGEGENDQSKAVSLLCDVFCTVIGQFSKNLHQIDVALQVRSALEQQILNVEKERQRLEVELDRNDDIRLRLRHRGKGIDFLHTMIEKEGTKIKLNLEQLAHRDVIIDLAIKLAKEYDWVVDLEEFEALQLPIGSTRWPAAPL